MNALPAAELIDRLGQPGRMREIAKYDIYEPRLHGRLDEIAARTAERLGSPMAMVSVLLDSAQFILGQHGLPAWVAESHGVPAEWTVCAYTVLDGEPYCVTDTHTDPRFAGHPVISESVMRSYAGVPLIDGSGQALGAHCVVDAAPRTLTRQELEILGEQAAEAVRILQDYRRPS